MKKRRWCAAILAGVMAMTTVTGCGSSSGSEDKDPLVVSSKDFTESQVLGAVYALAFEDAGIKVERKMNIGSSLIHDAIVNDEVDFYVGYTGTGLITRLGMDTIQDPQECYDTVKKAYEDKWKITWLDSTDINDSEGLFMLKTKAEELGITDYTQLWEQADSLVLGAFGEFYEDLYQDIKDVYGDVKFKDELVIDYALNFEACRSGQIDVFNQYTTNGMLSTGEFVELKDDQGVWPPYYICPLVRDDALEQWPEAEEIANKVTALLTKEDVIAMNAKCDVDGEDFEDVTEEYYESIKDKL